MKRNLLTVISRSVAGLLLCLWCGACTPKSGLTTSEWFTHAQMNTMDITKGDILLKEGMRNRAIGDYDGAFDKWLQAAAFFRETGRNDKLITVLNHMAAGYLEINDYDIFEI